MSEMDKKLLPINAYDSTTCESNKENIMTSPVPEANNISSNNVNFDDDQLISQAYDQYITLSQTKCGKQEISEPKESLPKDATFLEEFDDLISLEDLIGSELPRDSLPPVEDLLSPDLDMDINIVVHELLEDLISQVSNSTELSNSIIVNDTYNVLLTLDCPVNDKPKEGENDFIVRGIVESMVSMISEDIENEDLSEASIIATILVMEIFRNACNKAKHLKRWRIAKPATWKKNITKNRRSEGLPYMSKKNKVMAPKIPKQSNCSKCHFKCNERVTDPVRTVICRKYWSLDFVGKKNFILANVDIKNTKTFFIERKRQSKRSYSTQCSFTLEGEKIMVCQQFFCKTLCISQATFSNAIKNRDILGHYSLERDPRGRQEPPNKTPPEKLEEVRNHIKSFPTMDSHYIRKDSKRKYLDCKLSIVKMYSLYVKECENKGSNPVSEITYRRIFGTEFNLGFFLPKKDQCLLCTRYVRDKSNIEEEYRAHICRKKACNDEKKRDKQRAEDDKKFVSVSFDLQAILQIPSGDIGLLYYTRKLTIYNLTIYESAEPNEGYCFTWSEINGKKGSCEIGSILLYYLSTCLPPHVTEISLFSDTCGGQNRNKHVAALLFWAVQKLDNINVIEQKFLESGHSYMEADSMHSSIEAAQKNTSIYSMTEWKNVFQRARSKSIYKKGKKKIVKNPYHVKEFKYYEFKNLKDLSEKILPKANKDAEGNTVHWLKIKRIRYVKNEMKLYFNYDMSLDFSCININASESQEAHHGYSTRNKKRKLMSAESVDCTTTSSSNGQGTIPDELLQLYESSLPISSSKKKDLLNLCRKKVIPEEYHAWYESLNDDSTLKDRLPDLTVSDDDDWAE